MVSKHRANYLALKVKANIKNEYQKKMNTFNFSLVGLSGKA